MSNATLCRGLLAAACLDLQQRRHRAKRGAHQRDPLRQHRHRRRRSDRDLRARRHRPHRLAGRALQRQRRRELRHATADRRRCRRPAARAAWSSLNYPRERHPERIARRHRAGRRRRRRWSNSSRTKARSPRPTVRRAGITVDRHRRDRERAPSRSACRWRAMPPASGAARPRTPSAPATTTASTPPAPESRASRSPRRARRSTSAPRRRSRPRRSMPRTQPIAGVAFTWTSSDAAVATVSATGLATGVAAGRRDDHRHRRRTASPAPRPCTSATPPPPTSTDFHFNEIHYDNVGTDAGEAIEIEGPRARRSTGLSIVLYNGNGGVPYDTQALSGTLARELRHARRRRRHLSAGRDPERRSRRHRAGERRGPGGRVPLLRRHVHRDQRPGGGPHVDRHRRVGDATRRSGSSLQRSDRHLGFGRCRASAPAIRMRRPPGGNSLRFTGRTPSDPALPVGFEDQLFATLRGPGNVTIPTTITWTSETPAIASIDAERRDARAGRGHRDVPRDGDRRHDRDLFAADARRRGERHARSTPTTPSSASPPTRDPSDDFIVRHAQYTASYNPNRGTPNWVSYDLEATHFGAEDRCDCFTIDPALPATFPHLTTADYTGAGAFHGYGIDRGHLARSFDRTAGSLDNARTYPLQNIVPQAADQNQGPWAQLENDLGDLARASEPRGLHHRRRRRATRARSRTRARSSSRRTPGRWR